MQQYFNEKRYKKDGHISPSLINESIILTFLVQSRDSQYHDDKNHLAN